jgi:hypothetical protein
MKKQNKYNIELAKQMAISFASGNRKLDGFEDSIEKSDFLLMFSSAEELGNDVTDKKIDEIKSVLKFGTIEEKSKIILDILDNYKITDEVKKLLRTEEELIRNLIKRK